jgi:hypothetical protein
VLLPLAYFNLFAFKASEKQHIYSHNLLFLLAVFTFTFVTTGLVVRDGVSERLFIFVLPIYTLLASVGGMTLVQSLIANYSNGMKLSRAWPVAVLLLIFGVSASVALSTVQHVLNLERGPVAERTLTSFLQRPNPVALAEVGYGLPANKPGIPSGEGPAMLHQKLQQSLAAEDLLVSDTPMYANYLLRRPDAYLRQRLVNGETLVGFDSPTDEYFGIQLIDTLEELQLLKTSQQRTWIIVQNDPSHLSQEFLSYLESSFVKYYQNQFGIVYVNSPLDSGGLYQLDR